MKSTQTEKEWGNYWLENVILKNLEPEHWSDDLLSTWIWISITQNANTTIEIVESHIHLPWNWNIVCDSLIKSMDFVLKYHQTIPIDWSVLSTNTNISLENIEENLHLPWDFNRISCRNDLTLEFVRRHPDKEWNMLALSERANLWEDINKNAQNYCVYSAVNNPKITVEFIERHMDLYTKDGFGWYLTQILEMDMIGLDFIERHLELLISVKKSSIISQNPNVTVEFIRKHPDIDWDMYEISSNNPNITPEIVMANLDLDWDIDYLAGRSNFSLKDVQNIYGEHQFKWARYSMYSLSFNFASVPEDKLSMLNWEYLSQSPHVKTAEVIEKYKKYIDWHMLSLSPHITMKFVNDHPEYPWKSHEFFRNPNCSLEMYEKYKSEVPTHIRLKILDCPLVADKEAFIEERYREHLSAYRIQQCWFRARTDPNYALCRKKLEADWGEYYCKTLLTGL